MPLALESLVPRLRANLNAPGTTFFQGENSEYIATLANGFWTARLRDNMFAGYRVNVSNQVVPVPPATEDLPEDLHQVVVLYAALTAIEARLLSLSTYKRGKAGPVESETRRSAEVLVQLLKAKRAELEQILENLAEEAGRRDVYSYALDGVRARTWALEAGYTDWVS